MVQDEPVVQDQTDAQPRSTAGRRALYGGVAGACVLGAGLGLWARPSDLERPAAAVAKPAPVVTQISIQRRLPVVVDDSPAPIGKPMDVLSGSPPRPAVIPRRAPTSPPPAPELLAPTRPPVGLVRVAARPLQAPAAASARVQMVAQLQAAQARAEEAKADRADAARVKAAELKADQVRLHAARRAKAERARERAQVAAEERAAKAEAKAEHLAKLKARHEKLLAARAKARQIALAKAAPPPKPRRGLAILAHALARLAPHHAAPAAERAEAKPDRHHKSPKHDIRLAKAVRKPHAPPPAPPLVSRGAGPIRVANVSSRCASADPGEALACGDPNLGAAERRMTRAYRDAEAAGVSASTLQQQQARWKAARAAAAREAPWAVREVYQARIAELQDLTRDAQGGTRGN